MNVVAEEFIAMPMVMFMMENGKRTAKTEKEFIHVLQPHSKFVIAIRS